MFTWLGGKQASTTNPVVLEEVNRPLHSASLPRLQNTGRASHRIGGERALTHWLFHALAMIHTQPLSTVLSTVLKIQPYPWPSTEPEESMSVVSRGREHWLELELLGRRQHRSDDAMSWGGWSTGPLRSGGRVRKLLATVTGHLTTLLSSAWSLCPNSAEKVGAEGHYQPSLSYCKSHYFSSKYHVSTSKSCHKTLSVTLRWHFHSKSLLPMMGYSKWNSHT